MSQLKTTGQLRQFLADALLAVKNGHMDTDKARNITKMAAQINESFYSELKAARVESELGRTAKEMGDLVIGQDSEEKSKAA